MCMECAGLHSYSTFNTLTIYIHICVEWSNDSMHPITKSDDSTWIDTSNKRTVSPTDRSTDRPTDPKWWEGKSSMACVAYETNGTEHNHDYDRHIESEREWKSVCANVCMCVREREREKPQEREERWENVRERCMCVNEWERHRANQTESEYNFFHLTGCAAEPNSCIRFGLRCTSVVGIVCLSMSTTLKFTLRKSSKKPLLEVSTISSHVSVEW